MNLFNKKFLSKENSFTLHTDVAMSCSFVQGSKKAFTLSEIMMTVVIIGIVAVLIVPQIIWHFKEKELVASYLAVHTNLTNAYKEAEAVEGQKLYNLSPEQFKLKFQEHLKLIDCDEHDVCLVDGNAFDYECTETECNYLIIDTNAEKRPNKIGQDIFKFAITENGLVSEGRADICYGYDCGNYIIKHHKIFDGKLEGCNQYSSDGNCSLCNDGYKLNEGLCALVNTPNCTKYSGEYCIECKDGYRVNGDDDSCEQLEQTICHKYKKDQCTDCADGYALSDGTCNELETAICRSYYKDKCIDCGSSHYINEYDACSPLPSNCLAADKSGRCTDCGSSNYINESDTCSPLPSNCLTASKNGRCTECGSGFSINTSYTCTANIGNCSTYNTSGCQSCNSGYSVNTSGSCTANIGNCKTYKAGGCQECNSGYITWSSDTTCVLGKVDGQGVKARKIGSYYVSQPITSGNIPDKGSDDAQWNYVSGICSQKGGRVPSKDEMKTIRSNNNGTYNLSGWYYTSSRSDVLWIHNYNTINMSDGSEVAGMFDRSDDSLICIVN